jgi:hypothetical protein
MSFRSAWRGWTGELRGAFAQVLFLDSSIYKCFNDLIVPTSRGTSQIDHVIVSRYGVFVVEAKNRSGWIYGDVNDAKWTQVHFKLKQRFPNPLRQNYGHMKALEEHLAPLGVGLEQMHSVVTFLGDCRFKTQTPDNVLHGDHVSYVERRTTVLLSEEQVLRVTERLRAIKGGTGILDGWRHAAEVRERHESETTCPSCRSPLVKRIASRGRAVGSEFLGCSAYPRCRFTRNA